MYSVCISTFLFLSVYHNFFSLIHLCVVMHYTVACLPKLEPEASLSSSGYIASPW